MRTHLARAARALAIAACTALLAEAAMAQTVISTIDPNEKPGERPYEMVWAHRKEPAPPTLRFDDLRGWTMEVSGGAQATLQATRAQNVWNRPVARLRYRGDGASASTPRITIRPAQPVAIPADADCVDMWVWGNRWSWENPPGTPEVRIILHYRDASGADVEHRIHGVGWQEWWLIHDRLPAGMKAPAELASIEVEGGRQAEWREIYFDSIRFYRESLPPITAKPRPRRAFADKRQLQGANNGPGVLPFPTRKETILPPSAAPDSTTSLSRAANNAYVLRYSGRDGVVGYTFDPTRGLDGLSAALNDRTIGALMTGGVVRFHQEKREQRLVSARRMGGAVIARYDDGTALTLRISGKSLILEVSNATGRATGLDLGQLTDLKDPRTFYVPPITFGRTDPMVLLSRAGKQWVFTSIFVDWYRSNGSELYSAEGTTATTARINGGVRYEPLTNGTRNPLFERIVITCSPKVDEVLPTIPNPPALHLAKAKDRLWQESWGPSDYAKEEARSRMLRAYGIDKLTQCNHEITWRDGGESFTCRVHAAPKKGGDEALAKYVAAQRSLGWLSGLYTNYTDFAPINGHWDPDYVSRNSDGNWRGAWPRCYGLKPLRAVELDHELAPQVEARYRSNAAYTDVQTAVPPWGYVDMDARLPGAGTFAQTFYAYGELLRNDSRVYGGPIFSEGTYQWLYAGLADGNYGLTYNRHKLATTPLLPIFDLREIHTKECDIGCGWTGFFCDAIPNWSAPENIDRSIDRFILTTMAYGHIGWLVEEQHGIRLTCRSYYMLQQVQARYGGKAPKRIAYWDGQRLVDTSTAIERDLPKTRRQLFIEFEGGLRLWLNDHPTESWTVHAGKRAITLPPAGWAAWQPKGEGKAGPLLSWSALTDGHRVDYLCSAAYTYLDGRGAWTEVPEAATDGAIAILSPGKNRLRVIHVAGEAPFMLRRPYGAHGALVRCVAYDLSGKRLSGVKATDSGAQTWVHPVKGAVRYELVFSGKR